MTKDKNPPPVEQETKPKSGGKPASASGATGGKKILIVEDEKPLAHALALKMGHEGFETMIAPNGAEGMKEVLTGKYDIVLLDLIMPEVDGFAILQEMQAKKVTTPVIVLSNLGQDEDRERAKKLGAADYFVKANTPIAEILKKVKEIL